MTTATANITDLLGSEGDDLLGHECVLPAQMLHLPGGDFVDRVVAPLLCRWSMWAFCFLGL